MFGLSHPVVSRLVQELKHADKCKYFVPELSFYPPMILPKMNTTTNTSTDEDKGSKEYKTNIQNISHFNKNQSINFFNNKYLITK